MFCATVRFCRNISRALLGVVPLTEVLAAVLAAVLGVVTTEGPSRRARPWDDGWDVA